MAKFILLQSVATSIPKPDGEGFLNLSFHQQLTQVMRAPANPQAGADFEEVRKSLRVLTALADLGDGDTLELEDADYEHLRHRVDGMRFGIVDPSIVTFVEAVTRAESVAPLRLVERLVEEAASGDRSG